MEETAANELIHRPSFGSSYYIHGVGLDRLDSTAKKRKNSLQMSHSLPLLSHFEWDMSHCEWDISQSSGTCPTHSGTCPPVSPVNGIVTYLNGRGIIPVLSTIGLNSCR